MEQKDKYLVCTRCFTFNHAKYITDTMNGFTMQQTTFPFVCVIVDDASTDGEPEVIKSYLKEHFKEPYRKEETDYAHIICTHHKTNANCDFVVLYLKYNHYSIKKDKMEYISEWMEHVKYHALCEGDDYWIAPDKLQKQVDFMEVHPEHTLCFCAHREHYPDSHLTEVHRYESDMETCPMDDIISGSGGYMATCSMLYVAGKEKKYPSWAIGTPVGDLPLMLVLATRGKVGYINSLMCTYRLTTIGSWTYRIARNREMQRKHFKGSIKMWKGFDEYTEYKYHTSIKKQIAKIRKQKLRLTILYYIKYQFK